VDKAFKQTPEARDEGSKPLVSRESLDSKRSQKFEVKITDFGMQGFGYVLGGGFPTDAVYLLAGDPGTFYATFAQQALYSAVKKGQKVVYYTAEAASEDIRQDMALFGWDLDEYIDNGTWVFTRCVPPQLEGTMANTPPDPREQRIDLLPNSLSLLHKDLLSRLGEDRWSVISLSYLMKCYPAQEITDLVMFVVNAAHRLGGVHFILLPSGVHADTEVNNIKSLVDGVLNFKFAQGFEQAEGEIEIQKLRRVIPKLKVIRHVVQDNGIEIETTARVG
jgi:KaiC/GvpD/RAD55 family RecA-like ATPase